MIKKEEEERERRRGKLMEKHLIRKRTLKGTEKIKNMNAGKQEEERKGKGGGRQTGRGRIGNVADTKEHKDKAKKEYKEHK